MVKKYSLNKLNSLLGALFFLLSMPSYGATNQQRYKDFFRRQVLIEKQNIQREKGMESFSKARKREEDAELRRAEKYAKLRKSKDEDLWEKKLIEFEMKRDLRDSEKMERARLKYLANQKQNNSYEIPGLKEFDIQLPPLKKKTSSEQDPQDSDQIEF